MALASPLLCLLFSLYELWERHPAYHFFPLPLAALIWLAVRTGRRADSWRAPSTVSKALIWLHLLLAAAAFVLVSPFLAGVSFLCAATAFVLLCQNAPDDETPGWSIPVLALFLIPPPMGLDERMHQFLAGLATRLSEGWLDAMQVMHVIEGMIVVTPGKRFFVDDACSGANSMLVAVCVALMLCSFKNRHWRHAIMVALTAGLVSIATNVLRICLVIGSVHFHGVELDQGWAHEALGAFIFALDLLLVWSADHGWHFILNQRTGTAETTTDEPLQWSHSIGLGWEGRISLTLAIIGFVSLVGPAAISYSRTVVEKSATGSLQEVPMPREMSGWIRDGDKPLEDAIVGELGVRNQVWLYRKGSLEAYVAVNFPFMGFHDTRLCYSGQGWQFENQVDSRLPGETKNTVRFLDMQQPTEMMHAHLWLSVFDERGAAVNFVSENPLERISERLLSRWTDPPPVSTTYVLQVLAVEPGTEAQNQHAFSDLLAEARRHLASALTGQKLEQGGDSQ